MLSLEFSINYTLIASYFSCQTSAPWILQVTHYFSCQPTEKALWFSSYTQPQTTTHQFRWDILLEPEKLLQHKLIPRAQRDINIPVVRWLIKWSNHPESESTWEDTTFI